MQTLQPGVNEEAEAWNAWNDWNGWGGHGQHDHQGWEWNQQVTQDDWNWTWEGHGSTHGGAGDGQGRQGRQGRQAWCGWVQPGRPGAGAGHLGAVHHKLREARVMQVTRDQRLLGIMEGLETIRPRTADEHLEVQMLRRVLQDKAMKGEWCIAPLSFEQRLSWGRASRKAQQELDTLTREVTAHCRLAEKQKRVCSLKGAALKALMCWRDPTISRTETRPMDNEALRVAVFTMGAERLSRLVEEYFRLQVLSLRKLGEAMEDLLSAPSVDQQLVRSTSKWMCRTLMVYDENPFEIGFSARAQQYLAEFGISQEVRARLDLSVQRESTMFWNAAQSYKEWLAMKRAERAARLAASAVGQRPDATSDGAGTQEALVAETTFTEDVSVSQPEANQEQEEDGAEVAPAEQAAQQMRPARRWADMDSDEPDELWPPSSPTRS